MAKSSFGTVADTIYPDLDQEVSATRRMLERFPAGHNNWRPHDKSMPLANLASHVAGIPEFATAIVTTDQMDFAKGEYVSHSCDNAADLLTVFDKAADSLRAALMTADMESLTRPWVLRNGDHVIGTGRKSDLVRSIAINHMVHHRAQLGVYYRMLDVPVPATYGPSADEPL